MIAATEAGFISHTGVVSASTTLEELSQGKPGSGAASPVNVPTHAQLMGTTTANATGSPVLGPGGQVYASAHPQAHGTVSGVHMQSGQPVQTQLGTNTILTNMDKEITSISYVDMVTVGAESVAPQHWPRRKHNVVMVDACVGTPSLGVNQQPNQLVLNIPTTKPTKTATFALPVSEEQRLTQSATGTPPNASPPRTRETSVVAIESDGEVVRVTPHPPSVSGAPGEEPSRRFSNRQGSLDPRIPKVSSSSTADKADPVVVPSTRELIDPIVTPTLPYLTPSTPVSAIPTVSGRSTSVSSAVSSATRARSSTTPEELDNSGASPFQVVTSASGASRVVVVPDPSHVKFIPQTLEPEETNSPVSMAQHLAVAGPLHPMLAPPATTFLKAASGSPSPSESAPKRRVNEYTEKAEKLRAMIGTVQIAKPKSVLWLLQLMSKIYRGKVRADTTLEGTEYRLTMSEFVFDYLKQIYGRIKLVDDYAAALVSTIQHNRDRDVRVEMFARFLAEDWGVEVLTTYLNCVRALDEAKVGPEYSRGNDDGLKPNHVSVVRCLYTLGVLFKDDLKLPLLQSCSHRVKDESVPGDFNEYKEGMAKAGYNLSTLVVLPEGWNCDEATARGKIRRCDFLMIVCEETHAFVYNDEAAAGLF
eukprot:TRINITY_DN66845_c3_g3_i2.p1 TRINITY_DN66845_c3_g3~~TRINITY_DN66845_c3_g3_i2.p1  ORF type:complete len:737 (+),score=41.27 TRINITY_DN66845_c3_g3_i2:275-2212(+)